MQVLLRLKSIAELYDVSSFNSMNFSETRIPAKVKTVHSELPWGHRKISKIDETYIKLKFGTSDGIIVHYFCNFDWILAKFCNFMIGGRGLISLFWLIFISKWTIDCSYLWWRVEFLPNENISKLTCNRRFCW